MEDVQLYNGLIKATKDIVAQFGKEILAEQKFVNIYRDLYPDRDNPAKFRILHSIISEGVASDLLQYDKKGVVAYVNQQADKLECKYGYDKNKLKNTIYSLAVGADVISEPDFMKLISQSFVQPTPSRRQKPVRPLRPLKPSFTRQPSLPPNSQPYSDLENNGTNDSLFSKCVNDSHFVLGFFLSLLLLLVIGLFGNSFFGQSKKTTNELQMLENRKDSVVYLSIKNFRLGESFDTCWAKASDNNKFTVINRAVNTNSSKVYILGENLTPLVDSVKYINTIWGEDSVTVSLFAYDGMLMVIKVIDNMPTDSLVSIIRKNFGPPEKYIWIKKSPNDYKEVFKWTFKNAYIEVYDNSITLFDRRLDKNKIISDYGNM